MRYLRYLSFEIINKCPLDKLHPECPVSSSKRYEKSLSKEPITDQDVIDFVAFAKSEGFQGLITWHSYNEPLLSLDRILSLMSKVKWTRFCLWTSGILIKPSPDTAWLDKFEEVVITDYMANGKYIIDRDWIAELKRRHPHILVQGPGKLDNRMTDMGEATFNPAITGCGRPFFEMIIDYYGNLINCCGDWGNQFGLGNIKVDRATAMGNWAALRRKVARWDQNTYAEIPSICKKCIQVTPYIHGAGLESLKVFRVLENI